MSGTAPDGGLYVPEALPLRRPEEFVAGEPFAEIATRLLRPFFSGSTLENALDLLCAEALDFPVPLRRLEGETHGLSVLELFHGPTAASRTSVRASSPAPWSGSSATGVTPPRRSPCWWRPRDTGGAMASLSIAVTASGSSCCFPPGAFRRGGSTSSPAGVRTSVSLAVHGEFDDCQRLVKEAFADAELATASPGFRQQHQRGGCFRRPPTTRKASLEHWWRTGEPTSFIVPTGNLRQCLRLRLARRLGIPIAHRSRHQCQHDHSGFFSLPASTPRPSRATLASAWTSAIRATWKAAEAVRRRRGRARGSDCGVGERRRDPRHPP